MATLLAVQVAFYDDAALHRDGEHDGRRVEARVASAGRGTRRRPARAHHRQPHEHPELEGPRHRRKAGGVVDEELCTGSRYYERP
jgi:hypothetical protein